jgi:hypothetical protein
MHYFLIPFILIVTLWMLLSACTVSFQNISTNGKATDVVDDEFESKADVSPDIDASVVP